MTTNIRVRRRVVRWPAWASSVTRHLSLIAVLLVVLYPLLWLVVSSLRPNDEIFRNPTLWLDAFETGNYIQGWNALGEPFGRYLMNSFLVVAGAVVGNLLSCSMAAYAFARLKFRGRTTMFGIMLLTLMLPVQVIIVPQYVLFSQLHFVNTYIPLILPKFLATDAFFVFLMVQFIRGLPRELDEAARIDGAGYFRTFTQVLLPLMLPALATTAIFTFVWTWNDFFTSLIYLNAPDSFTVPLALRAFMDSQGTSNFGGLFAMSVVSLMPVVLVFLIGQKFLVNGIATTGLK